MKLAFGSDLITKTFLRPSQVAVYVHIPFCEYRCHYCDFYLETGWSRRVLATTLETVLIEFRRDFDLLGKPQIVTLYFGGGTPSVIPADLLEDFLSRFTMIAGGVLWQEGTFEMNPESCSLHKLQVLSRYGINRISLGVQTFQERFLVEMGRRSSLKEITTALGLLREHWRGDINLDLITGYPGQTEAELQADLAQVVAYDSAHISLYDLTVEPRTPLEALIRTGQLIPLSAQVKEDFWLQARDILHQAGYLSYETSNFAQVGHESQHNRRYWNLEPYLGVGAGAVSLLLAETGEGVQAVRRKNGNIFAHRRGEGAEWEWIPPSEFLFEHFLVGWRTEQGVLRESIKRRFGACVEEKLQNLLQAQFSEAVTTSTTSWRLTREKRDLLNSFLLKFEEVLTSINLTNSVIKSY